MKTEIWKDKEPKNKCDIKGKKKEGSRMTREEAIEVIRDIYNYTKWDTYTTNEARTMAIKALERQDKLQHALDMERGAYNALVKNIQCEDAISRQEVVEFVEYIQSIKDKHNNEGSPINYGTICDLVIRGWKLLDNIQESLPPVNPQEPKTGHCKDCKYFEYDSVAKVEGIPLIVAHEICKKWGDGCKTKEDGYCFMFKPQESEE